METRIYNLEQEKPPVELSTQEAALAFAMMHDSKTNIIDYSIGDGYKYVNSMNESELPELASKFKNNPKDCLGYARTNILNIKRNKPDHKEDLDKRVARYVEAFLDLQIKIDKEAYPPDDVVRNFVPTYIPDNLTDMGSDGRVNPFERGSREKIRVNKKEIFDKAKDFIIGLYEVDTTNMNLNDWKKFVIKNVAKFVYDSMPYNHSNQMPKAINNRSIRLEEIVEQKLAVCRHHALVTQVLLQSFGLTSRLLKCDLDLQDGTGFGPHAANLVRIDFEWYILDSTNPQRLVDHGEVYLAPIEDKTIDLNTKSYAWKVSPSSGVKERVYKSRNNMYFKISKD